MRGGRPVIAAAAYVAAMTGVVYGLMEPDVGYGSDAFAAAFFVGLVLIHLAAGAAMNRFAAVFLPIVAVAISVPAGYPDETRGEPLPIWFGLAIFAPFEMLLVGAGIALRRLVGRLRPPRV